MHLTLNDQLKQQRNFSNSVDSILDGYLEKELSNALLEYVHELNPNEMTTYERDIILSKLFSKSPETRAL